MARTRIALLVTGLLASLLMSSCTPSFTHPPDVAAGDQVDHTAYIGAWRCDDLGNDMGSNVPLENCTITISDDGAGQISVTGTELLRTLPAQLSNINGYTVAAIELIEGSWKVGTLSMSGDGNSVEFRNLDEDQVASDIQLGLLSGRLETRSDGEGSEESVVIVTSSGSDLREYLFNNRAALEGSSTVTFVRPDQQMVSKQDLDSDIIRHELTDTALWQIGVLITGLAFLTVVWIYRHYKLTR